MVQHKCILCCYTTKYSTNFKKHCETKKHLANQKSFSINQKNNDLKSTILSHDSIMNQSLKNDSQKNKCNFCNSEFANISNLYRHLRKCKMKKEGIFIVWNKNMMENNEKFYKIGKSSKRMEFVNNHIQEYSVSKKDIDFLYEIFLNDENFAEKILNILLVDFKINEEGNYKLSLHIIKKILNDLAYLINSNKINEDNLENVIQPLKEKIHEENTKSQFICNDLNSNSNLQLEKLIDKIESIEKKSIEKEVKLQKQNEELKKQIEDLKKTRAVTNIIHNQNNTINYLNINFGNVQTIEHFIHNLEYKYKLSYEDRKCLLNTYNECGIEGFADTFSVFMKKYQAQQVEEGILATMPVVCTDGNLRSFKEFHEDGWKTTQSNSNIDKMIDISNEQIYETEKTKVFISQKERKKVYNKIKQDNTLLDLQLIQKNYLEKKNKKQEKIELKYINTTDLDFSIIDDDKIEKGICDFKEDISQIRLIEN